MTDSVLTYESFLADMRKAMSKLATVEVAKPSWQRPDPFSFYGMKIINSPAIKPEYVGDHIDVIPISKNRSRRTFKKLCKRRRQNCKPMLVDVAYVFNGNIVASPRAVNQMNSIFKIEL